MFTNLVNGKGMKMSLSQISLTVVFYYFLILTAGDMGNNLIDNVARQARLANRIQ